MCQRVLTCILFSVAFGIGPALADPTTNWAGKPDGVDWSRFIDEAIVADGNRLVATAPADAQSFCPKYQQLSQEKRREVWANLFSLLTFYESGYDPAVKFTENFPDA